MKRYFIRFDDHSKVYVDRKFNLLDKDLYIKRLNQDGTTSFDNIMISQSRFKHGEVHEYNQMLKNKRAEILPIKSIMNLGNMPSRRQRDASVISGTVISLLGSVLTSFS